MNTGIVRAKASGLALMGKVLVGVMVLGVGVGPRHVLASVQDDLFRQYIWNVCSDPTLGPTVGLMCLDAFPGGPAGGQFTAPVSANMGTSNAGSGSASRKKKGIQERLEDKKDTPTQGASADGGGWGFLVTPQYGKSDRPETDLENGYQSKLTGFIVGLDYRFSDNFVLGGAIGQTRDKADFLNSAGFLKTSNNTISMYATWLPTERVAIDGYLGYGKLNFDSQRQVSFSLISGIANGTTSGKQVMAGMSASFQNELGRVNLAPFINLDYIKTNIDGYVETGTTLLELRFFDRNTTSLTGSLGARADTSYGYDWGALVPSARLAAVHEYQSNAQQISNELVITPGFNYAVATDAPDRDYLNLGLGVAAALNSGTQLFIDFEKHTQDKLLSSWAISLGGLVEF